MKLLWWSSLSPKWERPLCMKKTLLVVSRAASAVEPKVMTSRSAQEHLRHWVCGPESLSEWSYFFLFVLTVFIVVSMRVSCWSDVQRSFLSISDSKSFTAVKQMTWGLKMHSLNEDWSHQIYRSSFKANILTSGRIQDPLCPPYRSEVQFIWVL